MRDRSAPRLLSTRPQVPLHYMIQKPRLRIRVTISYVKELVGGCLFTALCLIPFALPSTVNAQDGVSSLSMGMSRAEILPTLQDIRIEEFINYHRHDIPLPAFDQQVKLSLKAGRFDNKSTTIQIGIATTDSVDREKSPPLNLVLVIDHSGSMTGDRIKHVKQAILAMVDQFRENDRITIVGFASEAHVILPACQRDSINKIQQAVKSIEATDSTNLHAGLMLGYREALRHFDSKRTNRVMLLTDGRANQGTTDMTQIVNESKGYNQEGISLTTIGLGENFNQELLRRLADAGRGLIHFVGDSKDIKKTFVKEVASLLSPAAFDVKLVIDFKGARKVPRIYGYPNKQTDDGKVTIELDDLNAGATQIVISRIPDSVDASQVTATLQYREAVTRRSIKVTEALDLSTVSKRGKKDRPDQDLRKNFAIAQVSWKIKKGIEQLESDDAKKSLKTLTKVIHNTRNEYESGQDPDIDRILKIAEDYRERIEDHCRAIARNDGHEKAPGHK